MTDLRTTAILAAGMLALAGLSGCEMAGPPPLQPLPSTPAPQACPRIYNPVCAGRAGRERTFPNACEAGSNGYSVHYNGQCQAGGSGQMSGAPGPSYGGAPGGTAGSGSGQMCAMIYKPVCGQRGGDTRTFPNSCQAANAGYRVIYHSECLGKGAAANGSAGGTAASPATGDQSQARQAASGELCSRAFVPVCGIRNGKKKTFINACIAGEKGYSVASQGRCG